MFRKSHILNHLLLLIVILNISNCSSKEEERTSVKKEPLNDFLHMKSPAWRDQVLYFIVTDRFMDGDSTNNDQGAGEYKKGHGGFWNGGDFKGITQKIDYIKALGATGIWITPPVANQWRNPQLTGTGNHGYWARSFVEVDKHYGTLEAYKDLSRALHKNDMCLIQDVVCNHLGDFYTYTGAYNPADVSQNFKVHDVPQPTQYPFNHNDANNPKDREMAIYHFAPNFYDHSDTIQKRAYQFADLDDLNTSNPFVRTVLRASYNYWIKEVGVDGFRFDTPHMVEHDFWQDFIHSPDKQTPGVAKYAKALGKERFLTFGETAVLTQPFDNKGALEAASYINNNGKKEMTSVLNFPLHSTIKRVFQEGQATNLMTYRIEETEKIFERPSFLLNFIDNHDGARFLSQTDRSSFRQALLFIMTIPGIPIIYYGTEQELLGTRQSMFKGGVGSPDQDHFITDNQSFRFVQKLIQLRKEKEIFRYGKIKILKDATHGPGIFAYELSYKKKKIFVLFNTSENQKIIESIPTALNAETKLNSIFSIAENTDSFSVDQEGNIKGLIAAKAGLVLIPEKIKQKITAKSGSLKISPLSNPLVNKESLKVNGTFDQVRNIKVSIDGDYDHAIPVKLLADGKWSTTLPLQGLLNGKHTLTAFANAVENEDLVFSDFITFELKQPLVFCTAIQDEKGDDSGPKGMYNYPAHVSYSGQMDIERVAVSKIGTNLQVDITMAQITQIWLPPNGFDHVLINIFIDLPNKKGANTLPFQNANMPQGTNWDYLLAAAGFDTAIFSSEGATDKKYGKAVRPSSRISVDTESRTISFLIPSESIGQPNSLKGTKIYVNTWGGGPGGLRDLNSKPSLWSFSGGTNIDPKIMDDIDILVLK